MLFHIYAGAGKKAQFKVGAMAQQYARWLSEINHSVVEVVYTGKRGGGIVGQYKHGWPTREFVGRGDEHYPAGTRRVETHGSLA